MGMKSSRHGVPIAAHNRAGSYKRALSARKSARPATVGGRRCNAIHLYAQAVRLYAAAASKDGYSVSRSAHAIVRVRSPP